MISLFATGDFLRVEVPNWTGNSVGLLIGIAIGESSAALVIGEDGHIITVPLEDVICDIRYDHEKDRFFDSSMVGDQPEVELGE